MENNYYPLRVGKESTIISDKNPYVSYNADEFDKHQGYVLAENIHSHVAKQIVDAYNEKYGPNTITQRHPLITVYGDVYSSRYKIIQSSDLLDDPNDLSELAALKAMDKLNSLLEKEGIVVVFKKHTPILRGHIGNELLKKSDVCVNLENSAHSFTEGHSIGHPPEELREPALIEYERLNPRETPSSEMQMKDALDRGGELPDSIVNTEFVDVEKVITDLLDFIRGLYPKEATAALDSYGFIQNAEAALGMLQAFKKERVVSPVDIADAHHAGKDIFNPETFKLPKINMDSPDFLTGMNYRKKDDDEKIKYLIAFTEDKIGTKIVWNNEHRFWQQVLPESSHTHWDESIKEMENRVSALSEKAIMKELREVFNLNQAESIINAIKKLQT